MAERSNSASNCLIGAAVAALLVCHFRFGDVGYLVWLRNRRWLLLAPVPVVLLLWLNPMGVGGRIVSVYQPAGDLDSNQFRWSAAVPAGK